MTLSAHDPVRWSPRRWTTTILALLVAQVALILYFGERPHELTRAVRSRTKLYLAVDEWSAKQIAEWPLLEDPTLFALPSMHGFSSKAWLTFPLLEYRTTEWAESPTYLALDPNQLGKSFAGSTNDVPVFASAGKPIADLLTLQLSIPPVNVRTTSELRIEGALQTRALLERFQLPSWPHEDLLTNTVVQLLVNERGDTLTTALLGSSSYKAADDYALKLAAGARFEPARGAGGYTSGRFIFQWHITPPPDTNTLLRTP